MCGIMGFVGNPKDSKAANLSYQLATKLLAETVTRGSHATGVYLLLPPKEGSTKERVFIYKLDAPSTQFVKTQTWRGLYKSGVPFLCLGHCRFYTHGSPQDHVNNHPHFSDDKKLSLIHNGVISGYEGLKKTYQVKGECDSEVLLRVIETEKDVTEGIKKVFRVVTSGSMACMVAQYDSNNQVAHFYAFRNDSNPLVFMDLREQLGQFFLASTKDIAEKAMKNSGMPKEIRKVEITEIPAYQIWKINAKTLEIEKIEVEKPAATTYGSNYYQGAGCRSRGAVSSVGDDDDVRNPFPSTVAGGTSTTTDKIKKVRALIDTIVESCTEIDEAVGEGITEVFGQTLEALETDLKDVAWSLEQVVNPALTGKDTTGTTTAVTTPEEYD